MTWKYLGTFSEDRIDKHSDKCLSKTEHGL